MEEVIKEFGLWKRHPITKAVFDELEHRKEELEEIRESLYDDPDNDTVEKLGLTYIVLSTRINQLDDLLNISIDELEDELEND